MNHRVKAVLPTRLYAALQRRWYRLIWFNLFKKQTRAEPATAGDSWLGRPSVNRILYMIKTGHVRRAKKALRWFLKETGDWSSVERKLPLAAFALKSGFHSKLMDEAARVYKNVQITHANKIFEQLVAGKTVAVVGNGPFEIGKRLGKEIDDHDIVIRFNNFPTDEYAEDYGIRTDIWSKASIDYIIHDRVDRVGKMVIHDMNLEVHSLKPGYVEAASKMLGRGLLVDYYPQEVRDALSKEGCKAPTSGFLMISTLKTTRVKYLDAYGFSFLAEGATQESYCTVGQTISKAKMQYNIAAHNMNFEMAYLLKLFKGGRRLIIAG